MNRFDRTRTAHKVSTVIIWGIITLLAPYGWAQAEKTPHTPEKPNTEAADTNSTTPHTEQSSKHTPRPRHPSSPHQQMEILARQLDNDETTQWINNGDDTFLAIWNADRTGDAKGAILIIHAEGEHPTWPRTTRPLHDSLPDYGWATMAIHLPNPHKKTTSPRTLPVKTATLITTQDNHEAQVAAKKPTSTQSAIPPSSSTHSSTKPIMINTESMSNDRLEAALQFLHDKGQFNVILMGSGVGAIRAHHFIKSITPIITDKKLKEKLEKPIQASIIFNARNRLPTDNNNFDAWFFDPEIPVLDIYTTHDIRNQKEAHIRKVLGKRKKVIKHDQIKIIHMNYEATWKENILSRRIRSFLEKNLKGIEINKDKNKE
jgi:hypothetical protein